LVFRERGLEEEKKINGENEKKCENFKKLLTEMTLLTNFKKVGQRKIFFLKDKKKKS